MAIFAEYQKPEKDPFYLGLSKEPDPIKGSQTASLMIKGVEELGSASIKAVDDLNKITINNELSKSINQERNASIEAGIDLLGMPSRSPEMTAGASNGLGVSPTTGEPLVGPTQTIPAPIELGLRQANKMAQANKQGKFDDVNYYGNMQVIIQNLSNRYPGYTDYIQSKAAGILGTNPANAQRNAIQATLQQLTAGANTAGEKWRNDVEKFGKNLSPEELKQSLTPEVLADPRKQDQFRLLALERQGDEHREEQGKKRLESFLTQGKVEQHVVESVATMGVETIQNRALSAINFTVAGQSVNGLDLNTKINELVSSGKPDPEAQRQIAIGLNEIKARIDLEVEKYYNTPSVKDAQGNLVSIASLMKNPARLEEIKKRATAVVTSMASRIGSPNLGLAMAPATMHQAVKDNAVGKLLMNETLQKVSGLEGIVGGQALAGFLNSAFIQDNFKQLGEVGSFLNKVNLTRVVTRPTTEEPKGLGEVLINYEKVKTTDTEGKLPPTPTGEYLKSEIDNVKKVLLADNKLPIEVRIKAAEEIFHASSTDFVTKFSKNEQFKAWANVSSPEVAVEMKRLSQTQPDLWLRYSAWTEATGKRLAANYLLDVERANISTKGSALWWNQDTQKLEYEDPSKFLQLRNRPTGMPLPRTAREAVDRLNIMFGVVGNVLKQDDKVITKEYLQKLGFDIDAPAKEAAKNKQASDNLFQSIGKALSDVVSEPELFQPLKGSKPNPR